MHALIYFLEKKAVMMLGKPPMVPLHRASVRVDMPSTPVTLDDAGEQKRHAVLSGACFLVERVAVHAACATSADACSAIQVPCKPCLTTACKHTLAIPGAREFSRACPPLSMELDYQWAECAAWDSASTQ